MNAVTPFSGVYGEVLGAGPGGPLPATTPWNDYGAYLQYPGGLVLGTATGGNQGAGTLNCQALFINGVEFDPSVVGLDAGTY